VLLNGGDMLLGKDLDIYSVRENFINTFFNNYPKGLREAILLLSVLKYRYIPKNKWQEITLDKIFFSDHNWYSNCVNS
jgi:hypothetical protein